MAYTIIETFAIIIAVFTILKIAVLYLSPVVTRGLVRNYMKKEYWYNFYTYLAFVIFAILFYFMIQEISIFYISAGIAMGMLLFFLWIAAYPKRSKSFCDASIKDPHKAWFSYLLMLVVSLWVLWLVLM